MFILLHCDLLIFLSVFLRTLFKVSSNLNFFWNFLKSYCASAFKVTSFEMKPCCNKKFLCLQLFSFVETGSMNEKSVCHIRFLCNLKIFIQNQFLYWDFLFVCKTMQNLNVVWIISSVFFSFIASKSCMD